MAILINGNGNPAIYPDQDADWFASIFGGQTAITGVGSQFAAEIQDANTIALADGVIITKEGRRIQLDANQSDIFEIPTGAQGTTNYYIIGYCLTTNDDSSQTAETFVELMENATDTIEEDTFRDGADKVYVSLYRVTQTGFNLETPELLLPQVGSITQLNADLTANSKKYSASYQNGKYGFEVDGTFYPLSGTSKEIISLQAWNASTGLSERDSVYIKDGQTISTLPSGSNITERGSFMVNTGLFSAYSYSTGAGYPYYNFTLTIAKAGLMSIDSVELYRNVGETITINSANNHTIIYTE